MSDFNPSFALARLFAKTSASGNLYFTGRLGGSRVTLLKSREVADDGGEIWQLMVSEATPRASYERAQRQRNIPATDGAAKADYQRPPDKHTRERAPGPDDQVPF